MAGLQDILGQPHDAPAVRAAFAGFANAELERIGDRNYLAFEDDGVRIHLLYTLATDAIQMVTLTRA